VNGVVRPKNKRKMQKGLDRAGTVRDAWLIRSCTGNFGNPDRGKPENLNDAIWSPVAGSG